jgi:serine/threonine protein kinase
MPHTIGDASPLDPRAHRAPDEEPTATNSIVDDDAALALPPPPAVVPPPPPQPAAAPPARLKNGSGIRLPDSIANIFTVDRYLAEGGCGEVYLARQVETGGGFALKRVPVASQGTARWKDELNHCAEANIMLQLSRHANVMAMHYCIVFASEFFMFFDLIDGARDVIGAMTSGKLYKGESGEAVRARCLSILTQAAVAIAFVNEQGVLHEDVKHENGECVARDLCD